eukprot:2821800-Amphidinium_carterae.1
MNCVREFVRAVVRNCGYLEKHLAVKSAVVLVEGCGHILQYAPESCRSARGRSRHIVLAAVQQDGRMLQYA